jgi:2-amino-4-hydroxy-6-hydroxymethyldihydropteridine diphosphokinase
MATSLIALGSNLGDRTAVLDAAIKQIDSVKETRVIRASHTFSYPAIGGTAGQPDFLNAAVLLETKLSPGLLLDSLLEIEAFHGRQRSMRWEPRTLDLDLLLYDDLMIETSDLVVPHPRMSFRGFVLEPTAEIAGDLVHPVIGWSIQRLLDHWRKYNDRLAIISDDYDQRAHLARWLMGRFQAEIDSPPIIPTPAQIAEFWPQRHTTWMTFSRTLQAHRLGDAAAGELGPKLTLVFDALPPKNRDDLYRFGQGPALFLGHRDLEQIEEEVSAAILAAWPDLGRSNAQCVE